jgi:hypothetical protein
MSGKRCTLSRKVARLTEEDSKKRHKLAKLLQRTKTPSELREYCEQWEIIR